MLDMIIPAIKVKMSGDLLERLVFKTLSILFYIFALCTQTRFEIKT